MRCDIVRSRITLRRRSMAIEEHYRTIRNSTRRLATRESLYVVWAYSQFLQRRDFVIPRDIEVSQRLIDADPRLAVLPDWTIEHIARELICHGDERPRNGHTLRRWAAMAELANAFRDLENELYRDLGGGFIRLEMMRIMHRQFVWQQQRLDWHMIIRYFKLFNTPAIAPHAAQATGLTVEQIYLIGMCYLGMFFDSSRALHRPTIELPGITQDHVDRFLAFTSLSRRELASRLRAEHTLDAGFAYRYSSLRAFPLVRFSYEGKDEVACPIPLLLFWRITTGLYYTLKDQSGFPTAFGASFQAYVGEVLRQRITNPAMAVLPEAEYRVGLRRKDSVDWIVQQGEAVALFVECKTMRLTWASKAGLTDLNALEQDIRKLAGAVVQVYRTIRDYRAGFYPQCAFVEQRRIFPAVVTLEDWYCFGLDLPVRLAEAVRTAMEGAGLPIAWLQDMPYIVLSVHEFERASGVMSAVGIAPFVAPKVEDADLNRWPFVSYCNDRFPEAVSELPDLFHDEYEAMFADVAAEEALG